jgi:ketosteroid isomerase-like protein
MTRNLFLTLLCAGATVVAAAPEDAVKQAEKDWAVAVVKKDYTVLDRVFADDLQYTHSDGRLDTKQSYLESLKSGKQTYHAAEHQSIDVKMMGKDVALVRAMLRMTAVSGTAQPTPANFSVLRVYRLRGGNWQMVAHQSARLAK